MASESEQVPRLNIRKMTAEDIGGVLAIDQKIVGSNRAITYTTVPGSFIGGELDLSVVTEACGRIVGFLLGRMTGSPYSPGNAASLEMIGVDPEYQRRGIGTGLVDLFIQLCKQKEVKSVRTIVSWHDWWLLSFLRSLGFARGEMAEFTRSIEV